MIGRSFARGSAIRVSFIDFWPGFNPLAYFVPLLRAHPFDFDVEVIDGKGADIEFHSVFPSTFKRLTTRARRKISRLVSHSGSDQHVAIEPSTGPVRIWFTGENLRPPLGKWCATLSFDQDSDLAKNAYFPLWWQLFPELIGDGQQARPGIVNISRTLPLTAFLSGRQGQADERRKFACAIISNPEPTRMRMIETLEELGAVDVFGHFFGKSVHDKHEIFRDYRFALCFENDLYPGYVTEKIFDAWGAGCIPLWWGLDQGSYLNADAFINLAAFEDVEGFVREVASLNGDAARLRTMSSLPLLLRRPNLDRVRALLASCFLSTRNLE